MQNLDSKGVTGRFRRFQLFVERVSHAVFLQLRENASRGSESRWIMRLGCEIACKAGAEKISQAFGHDWRILARQVEAGGSPLFARKKRRMASARLGQVKGGATRQILRLFAYRIHCARAGGNYLQTALGVFGSACRMRAIPPRGCSWAIEFRNKGQQHPRRRMQGIGMMSHYSLPCGLMAPAQALAAKRKICERLTQAQGAQRFTLQRPQPPQRSSRLSASVENLPRPQWSSHRRAGG